MNAEDRDPLMDEVERCRDWLEAALDRGGNTHDVADIYHGVAKERYQFWPAEDAVIVTEVLHYPNCQHLHFWLIGGNLETIHKMRPDIERFAQHIGCSAITGSGRPGWVREMGKHGYKEVMRTVIKKLDTMT